MATALSISRLPQNTTPEIRKAIYTTNAIESLNSVIRKAVNHRKIFAHANSAFKVVFMTIEQASKK